MDLRKDQHNSPAAETQKPHEDGPEFDFESPEVEERADGLREAAAQLKVELEVRLAGKADFDYPELLASLDRLMVLVYARYDEYVSALMSTSTLNVTCSKSCSHCCSHYVTSVEPYELLHLHSAIRDDEAYPGRLIAFHRRVSAFRELLGRESMTGSADLAEDKALYRYFLKDTRCPFLTSEGACGVYASRPMSCRMFFSLSHPSFCRGKSAASPGNRNFIVELPEDIETLLAHAGMLFSRFALPEGLFEGLLKVNEVFGSLDHVPRPAQSC